MSNDGLDGAAVDFRGELLPDLVHRPNNGHVGMMSDRDRADFTSIGRRPDHPVPEASSKDRSIRHHASEDEAELDDRRSFLYDEWNYHRERYLPAWCRLFEQRLRGDNHDFIGEVRSRYAELTKQVGRQFGFFKPDAWHRVHRTADGDEFGLDAVIEAVIDRRAGHANDEHLYIRRDRALREVAAAFLIDMSASTSSPIPEPIAALEASEPATHSIPAADDSDWWADPAPPIPPERCVLDIAKESMAVMGDALQVLGDSYAIYGFSGRGAKHVEFHIAKEFNDAASARTWSALAAMKSCQYTRMGPAIRHTTTKLNRQPMRTKLLIMVSDGYPQDQDYGPDRTDAEYGLQDTAVALREAERAGISTFCITIDPAGHDYLRRMCPEQRYLVIDDVLALPSELAKVYRALTVGAPLTSSRRR